MRGGGAMLIVNLLFVELILKYLFKMQAAGCKTIAGSILAVQFVIEKL